MANSTKAADSRKPHPDYPLTPRADGRWCKKVRGKLHIFAGTAQEALDEWLRVKDDLLAGRKPRPKGDGLTVEDLCDHFLTAKERLRDNGELTARTYTDYYATCERILKAFGKSRQADDLRPEDFDELRASIAQKWGHVALSNEINRVRVVFKYGFDAGLLDRPVRYGPTFKRPSRKTLRKARHAKGPRMFEAAQVRKMLAAASPQLRAMFLLGINCGFGNADCGTLPTSALDLQAGWLDYPRPKTGIERRCPLWPETMKALKAAIASRVEPRTDAAKGLVFVTRCGDSWAKADGMDNPVSKETAKLLKALGIARKGLNFYALRHTFETVAGESKDQVATSYIMGHAPHGDDMASVYRERISDERLSAVVNHVRGWLFAKSKNPR